MEESVINDFQNILNDFIKDLETTFPDYNNHWKILKQAEPKKIFDYCVNIYPERFFDILYQNDDIFKEEENINTFFLPSLDFKTIFNDNTVSDSTNNGYSMEPRFSGTNCLYLLEGYRYRYRHRY